QPTEYTSGPGRRNRACRVCAAHFTAPDACTTFAASTTRPSARSRSAAVADELVVLGNCDQIGDTSTCHRLSGVDEVVIGRGARRDVERRAGHLSLTLADGRVSSTHATIVREGAAFVLVDTGSKNGVLVNGTRVCRHILRDGDIFECGRTFFRYRTAQKRRPETPL